MILKVFSNLTILWFYANKSPQSHVNGFRISLCLQTLGAAGFQRWLFQALDQSKLIAQVFLWEMAVITFREYTAIDMNLKHLKPP